MFASHSDFYRFSPTGLIPSHPHAGLSPHAHPHHVHSLTSHPAIVTPGPKQELPHQNNNHRYARSVDSLSETLKLLASSLAFRLKCICFSVASVNRSLRVYA